MIQYARYLILSTFKSFNMWNKVLTQINKHITLQKIRMYNLVPFTNNIVENVTQIKGSKK